MWRRQAAQRPPSHAAPLARLAAQAQESVGDATMQQEVELMEKLVAAPSA